MKKGWANDESGSALLLVMVTAIVAGLLFASLYVIELNEHKQTLVHEAQVLAEYKAQTLMNVALYYEYLPDSTHGTSSPFIQKLPNGNSCIDEQGNAVAPNAYPNVCLKTDAAGRQTLIATGTAKLGTPIGTQTYTLAYTLPPTPSTNSTTTDDTRTRD